MHPRFFPFGAARLHAIFSPRKPRHFVLRALFAVVGLVLLSILLFFGIFIGGAMVAGGLAYRAFNQRERNHADVDPNVVEGEYRVVRDNKPALPLSR